MRPRTRTWPDSVFEKRGGRTRCLPLDGGDATQAFDIDFSLGTLLSGWTFVRGGSATYINASGLLVTAGTNEPRFTYTSGVCDGLLMEGQQANYLCHSETFLTSTGTNQWVDGGTLARLSTGNTAPDGTASALQVQVDELGNSTCINNLSRTPNADSGGATFSIWLRRVSGAGSIQLTQNNGGAWTTVAVASTWKRFELPFWPTASGAQQVGVRGVTAFDTFEMWGAQLEDGSGASSYIKTTTASSTRLVDLLSCLNLSQFGGFDPTATTLLLDLTFRNEHSAGVSGGSAYPYMMGLFNGSNANYSLQTIYNNAGLTVPRLMCHVRDGANVTIGSNPVASRTALARVKYAVSLSGSGTVTRLTSSNGSTGGSASDGTGPVQAADRLLFHDPAAHYARDMPSYTLRRLGLWRQASTQAQLNALTA